MITGLSHVSIVVPSLADAAAHLKRVYGLELGEVKLNADQGVRLAYVELGNARIELMEPSGPDSPVARFLERNPRGAIHHFCLAVDDVEATSREVSTQGARVLGDGSERRNVHGERIAFLHPKDFLGALVELEEDKR